MAFSSISATPLVFSLLLLLLLLSTPPILPSPLIDELNQPPPPGYNTTVTNDCQRNPTLRYCNATADLPNIFKSTVVARYLCAESRNPDCSLSFARIDLRSRPKLAPLYLSFHFFWKYCPLSIQSIDLSNNSLIGAFPSDILLCTQIQSLDLSGNELIGELPIDRFSLLTNLSFLNLSYNRFSDGGVQGVPYFDRFNLSSFIHSGLLPGDHHRGFKVTTTILLLIGVLVSVVSLVGCLGCVFVRHPDLLPHVLRRDSHRFTPSMLKKATDGFSEENLVWKGGTAAIYRGLLMDGYEVEIKVQKGRFSGESRMEFDDECRVLVGLRHKNLARVMGWCDNRELRALVTEAIGVCSVEEWLMDSPPWKRRLKVLMGVVEGMLHLQEQGIRVGYDLKISNVMMSDNGEPMISKFRVGDHNTESRKVYKLGLFLLELVTTKRPREVVERGESGFVEWVRMHCPGHSRKVIDEKMKLTTATYEQVKQAIEIGLVCTDLSVDRSPTINQISIMIRRVSAPCTVQTMPSLESKKERRHEIDHILSR